MFLYYPIVSEQFRINPYGSHHVNACLSFSTKTVCAFDPSDPWRMRCRLCCTTHSTSWKSRTCHSNSYSLQRCFGRNGKKGWTYQLYCKFDHILLPYFNTIFHAIFLQLNTPTRFDDLNDIIGKDTDPSNSALHTPVQVSGYLHLFLIITNIIHCVQNLHQDSGYMTDKRQTTSGGSSAPCVSASTSAAGKENIPGNTIVSTSNGSVPKSPNRRARKALHATWSTPGNIQVPGIGCDSISFLPETPVSLFDWFVSKYN